MSDYLPETSPCLERDFDLRKYSTLGNVLASLSLKWTEHGITKGKEMDCSIITGILDSMIFPFDIVKLNLK